GVPYVVGVVREVRSVGEELLDGRGSKGSGEAGAEGHPGTYLEESSDGGGNRAERPFVNRDQRFSGADRREVGGGDPRVIVSTSELNAEGVELQLLVEEGGDGGCLGIPAPGESAASRQLAGRSGD